jgi:hypothetical protein
MPEPDPHAKVVRLTTASDPQQAARWQQALQAEGVRCHVVGEYLGGLEGPPPGYLGPELWVREDDLSRARAILARQGGSGA